jgi:hypothetical protein
MPIIKGFKSIKNKPLATLSGRFNLSQTKLGQDFFGDMRLGDKGDGGSVKLEGTNNRIIINDGTNDRILIGYQSGGF